MKTENWKIDLDAARAQWRDTLQEYAADEVDALLDDADVMIGWFEDEENVVEIGDEIEGDPGDGIHHSGVVVGVIRDCDGRPVCYKIWSQRGDQCAFDYVSALDVVLHEPCEDAEQSLRRIGYKLVEEADGFSYFTNKKTGDVAIW